MQDALRDAQLHAPKPNSPKWNACWDSTASATMFSMVIVTEFGSVLASGTPIRRRLAPGLTTRAEQSEDHCDTGHITKTRSAWLR